MALQLSVEVRNAILAAVEATIGTSPIIEVFTGSMPANTAAADSGTKIAEGVLPSNWLGDAASGVSSKAGTWEVTGNTAASTGTNMGHIRIKDSTGTTCHKQMTITVTGGGGDVTVTNLSIADDQVVTFNSFSLTAGNA